jgi:uncharacterized low-complexity protein
MKKLVIASATVALALGMSAPSFAAGKKSGFDTIATQGSSGKPANTQNSTKSQGDTTVVGPYGQVKQGKSANTTSSGPGKSMP